MSIYQLVPNLIIPQGVLGSAAKLTFGTPGSPQIVPDGLNYQILVLHAANVSGATITFKVWRVPVGQTANDTHIVVPTITLPIPSQTYAYFDVTSLWGAILGPGDSIWATCGTPGGVSIQGDGAIITV